MSNIITNELGFAGFLMLKKLPLIKYEKGQYVFESEQTVSELRVEWINSDFAKYDRFIQELKRFK